MDPIEVLLEILIHNHLRSYCLTIIAENLECNYLPQHMTSIRLKVPDVGSILRASEMNCSDYLIQSEHPEEFIEVYSRVNKISNIRRGDRKLIFVPSTNQVASKTLEILQLKELAAIANVLLLIPTPNEKDTNCGIYELMTHQFTGIQPDWSKPKLLDRWSSCTGFERQGDLFPHSVRNMYGRPVKVACFTYKPFTILDLDPSVSSTGRDGIDMRTLEEFCKWINCSIEVVDQKALAFGAIDDNGSGEGVLGTTAAGLADLATTSLGAWWGPYRHLDFSSYSFRAIVSAIVPSPKLISVWELPLLAFSWATWALVAAAMAVTSLGIVLAQRGSSKKVLWVTTAIICAQPQKITSSNTWHVRRVVGWLILTGLVINVAYCAGLASLYTVAKYGRPIDTVQDLINSGMEWGATHAAWTYSLAFSKKEETKKLLGLFRVYSPEVLKQRSENRSMAFGVVVMSAGYAAGDYLTMPAISSYQLMREQFYYEYGVVMAPKNSPYISRVTDMLGRLHQSGLMLAFDTQVTLKYSDYKVQLAIRYSRKRDKPAVAALSYHHVVGIFMMYAAGIVASILVFLLEVLKARGNHKNK